MRCGAGPETGGSSGCRHVGRRAGSFSAPPFAGRHAVALTSTTLASRGRRRRLAAPRAFRRLRGMCAACVRRGNRGSPRREWLCRRRRAGQKQRWTRESKGEQWQPFSRHSTAIRPPVCRHSGQGWRGSARVCLFVLCRCRRSDPTLQCCAALQRSRAVRSAFHLYGTAATQVASGTRGSAGTRLRGHPSVCSLQCC